MLSGDLLLLAAVILGRALCSFGFEAFGRTGALRVTSELRSRVTAHLLLVRPTGARDQRAGEVATNFVNGLESLEEYFARYLPQVVLAALVPIVILIYVFPRDFAAGTILLLTLPVIPLFMVLIGLAARTATDRRWKTLSLLSSHFLDAVKGIETLKANDRAEFQVGVLRSSGEQYRRETMVTLRIAFLSALVLELCAMIGVALVAAAVSIQLIDGHLGFATALAVLLLAPELYMPVRMVGQQFHASTDGLAAANACFELLDTPAAVGSPQDPAEPPHPSSGPLSFTDVSVRYPGRTEPAIAQLNMTVEPGETVAIVGPSGAGKSTAAALVLRLLNPTSGKVTCAGVDLTTVDPVLWRQSLAWVPQRATIFRASVAENVRLGAPGASDAEVHKACSAAGLDATIGGLPNGVETLVGEGGRALSAGEAQRVALARAFLRDAPLVILDEPTAHLDMESSRAVGDAIANLCAGRTVILIAHRPELAAMADRVIRIGDVRERAEAIAP